MHSSFIQSVDQFVIAGDAVGNADSRFHTFPSLTRCADGSLICTALVGSTKSGPDGRIRVFRSSGDYSKWDELSSPTAVDERSPQYGYLMCHIVEMPDRRLVAIYLRADRFNPKEMLFHPKTDGMQRTTVRLCESMDYGRTWSEPWDLDYHLPDLVVPSRPMVLPDGAILVPFEVWHEWDKGFRQYPSTRLIASTDGGKHWHERGILACSERCQFVHGDPRLSLADDGRIVALVWKYSIISAADLPVHKIESTDLGYTWQTPVDTGIAGQIANPVALDGDKMVAIYQKRFGSVNGLHIVMSRDNGNTWDASADLIVWSAPTQADSTNPFIGYNTYAFGYSNAFRFDSNSALVSFWATNGTTSCIRLLKISFSPNT